MWDNGSRTMAMMAGTIVLASCLALGGFFAGRHYEAGKNAVVAMERMAQSVTAVTAALNSAAAAANKIQKDGAEVLRENKDAETHRDAISGSIGAVFDGLRNKDAGSAGSEAAPAGDSCAAERREAGKLRGELQRTLGLYEQTVKQYNAEAFRADENTRYLNQCIRTLNTFKSLEAE